MKFEKMRLFLSKKKKKHFNDCARNVNRSILLFLHQFTLEQRRNCNLGRCRLCKKSTSFTWKRCTFFLTTWYNSFECYTRCAAGLFDIWICEFCQICFQTPWWLVIMTSNLIVLWRYSKTIVYNDAWLHFPRKSSGRILQQNCIYPTKKSGIFHQKMCTALSWRRTSLRKSVPQLWHSHTPLLSI